MLPAMGRIIDALATADPDMVEAAQATRWLRDQYRKNRFPQKWRHSDLALSGPFGIAAALTRRPANGVKRANQPAVRACR